MKKLVASNEKNVRKNLFENARVWKSLLYISSITLVIALLNATFSFSNQLLIINLIPSANSGFSVESVYLEEINNQVVNLNQINNAIANGFQINISDIVKNSIAFSSPIIFISFGTIVTFSSGMQIAFGRALGKKNDKQAKEIWDSGLKTSTITYIIITIFLIAISIPWINFLSNRDSNFSALENPQWNLTQSQIDILDSKFLETSKKWAWMYTMISLAVSIIQIFTVTSSSFLSSEGKLKFSAFTTFVANIANICFVTLFILVFKLGMNGAALATGFGLIFNALIFIFYLRKLNRKNQTLLFLDFKFRKKIIWYHLIEAFFYGFNSFLRFLAYTLLFTFLQSLLLSTILSISKQNNDLLSSNSFQIILGAIIPIFNLFLSGINGLTNAIRILGSYSYGQKQFHKIKKIYYFSILYGWIYSFLIVIIFAVLLRPFLFGFDNEQGNIFLISIFLLYFAFTVTYSASTLLSAGNILLLSNIIASLQILISTCFLFIASIISINFLNINIFIWAPFFGSFLASIVNAIIMIFYFKYWKNPKNIEKNKNSINWTEKILNKLKKENL